MNLLQNRVYSLKWAIAPNKVITDTFDPTAVKGLSEEEAFQRLQRDGYNELPSEKPKNPAAIFLQVFSDPIFLLMVASGLIYLILGDLQEALILLGFVCFIMGISFYEEIKTEHALSALRHLTSPRALVIRDRIQKRIPGREVVHGDTLILKEGDRVPADAKILWSTHLSVDESLLTGESMPVGKEPSDSQNSPFVFSGTLAVQGSAVAEVTATGIRTEIGKIGKVLQTVETEKTLLQKQTQKLVRLLAIVGLILCAIVVIAYGLTRSNWLEGFLAGITLAMAILPNEFPVVLTIFLALGAWRISQKSVLTRRVPAIENLGAATVLCVDKTGTLTLNQMSIQKIFVPNEFYDLNEKAGESLPETFHELVEFGILASQRDPFDPIEKALKELGNRYLENTEHIHNNWTLVREYPLSSSLLALSHVWESPDGEEFVIGCKGAPEAIFDLCHLENGKIREYTQAVRSLAGEGLRVLGVARARFKKPSLPPIQHDFEFEFLGVVGFADPIRPTVPSALKECYQAGIRVVMMTGDYPETAESIARQVGLKSYDRCLTGAELEKMTDAEFQRKIKEVNIFARVRPEQKLRLVRALQANGEVVAMTGDGVNDAPALKAADIGIAMGKRGTDVARESADLVLIDDDFFSIVKAVEMGRRIFDNLKKAMAYLLAIHIPIAGLSLIPVLFKWPLVLLPVHIAFLHLIINPACSVVFEMEPEEADIMNRPPRHRGESPFNKRMLALSFLQGISILAMIVGIFAIAWYRGQGESDARALAFTTLIIANLSLIFTNRSWSQGMIRLIRSPNAALWWVTMGGLVSLGLILYVPFLQNLFRFSHLHFSDLVICFSAGIASILWFEGLKIIHVSNYFKRG